MTAEVVIINQQAVALAADSAVTVGQDRVWKHANKLFSAGPRNDIGIMVYNSSDFLGVPWEVIVKGYRRKCSTKTYAKVADFADDFLRFVANDLSSKPERERLSFSIIVIDILESIKKVISYGSRAEFDVALMTEIEAQEQDLLQIRDLQCPFSLKEFKKEFSDNIKAFARETFGYQPRREHLQRLDSLVYSHLCHESESEFSTGLIIAGYGRKELFPSIHHYVIDGRAMGFSRCWKANVRDLNETPFGATGIIPFGQADMAYMFMEGIYHKNLTFLSRALSDVLEEKSKDLVENFVKNPDERTVELALQTKDNKTIVSKLMDEFAEYRTGCQ